MEYSINYENAGINFIVKLNNKKYSCLVSQEALQDIDSSKKTNDIEYLFKSNQSTLENIAIDMIKTNSDDKIFISTEIIKKFQ